MHTPDRIECVAYAPMQVAPPLALPPRLAWLAWLPVQSVSAPPVVVTDPAAAATGTVLGL